MSNWVARSAKERLTFEPAVTDVFDELGERIVDCLDAKTLDLPDHSALPEPKPN